MEERVEIWAGGRHDQIAWVLTIIIILPLWIFVAAHRLFPSCGEQGLFSDCGVRASRCGGFSCRARPLGARASVSCSARPQLPQGVWGLPRPGTEPMSPKSKLCVFKRSLCLSWEPDWLQQARVGGMKSAGRLLQLSRQEPMVGSLQGAFRMQCLVLSL